MCRCCFCLVDFMFWKNKTLLFPVLCFLFPFSAIKEGLGNIATNNTIIVFPTLSLILSYPDNMFLLKATKSLGRRLTRTDLFSEDNGRVVEWRARGTKTKFIPLQGRKTCKCVEVKKFCDCHMTIIEICYSRVTQPARSISVKLASKSQFVAKFKGRGETRDLSL